MLMILSPAKTLNLKPQTECLPLEWTKPLPNLKDKHKEVVSAVKEHAKSTSKQGKILKTSTPLTTTAQAYWKTISSDASGTSNEAKPAILTFDGAAYNSLNV